VQVKGTISNDKSNVNQAHGADKGVKMFKGTRTRCKTAHGAGGSLGTVLAGRVHKFMYMSRLKVQQKSKW
jgi:hypothetical protein